MNCYAHGSDELLCQSCARELDERRIAFEKQIREMKNAGESPEQMAEARTGSGGAEDVPYRDDVNRPDHYTSHPSGVECIEIVEHMSFNLGNAIKYLWRSGKKSDALTDLRKAIWYIEREISRLPR